MRSGEPLQDILQQLNGDPADLVRWRNSYDLIFSKENTHTWHTPYLPVFGAGAIYRNGGIVMIFISFSFLFCFFFLHDLNDFKCYMLAKRKWWLCEVSQFASTLHMSVSVRISYAQDE